MYGEEKEDSCIRELTKNIYIDFFSALHNLCLKWLENILHTIIWQRKNIWRYKTYIICLIVPEITKESVFPYETYLLTLMSLQHIRTFCIRYH